MTKRRPVGHPYLPICLAHGFVHETPRDEPRQARWSSTRTTTGDSLIEVTRTQETAWNPGDGRRSAHNPEVAGSNPAPATNSASQRPLPETGGAFLLSLGRCPKQQLLLDFVGIQLACRHGHGEGECLVIRQVQYVSVDP
jgi:hypothetical protein